MAFINVQRHYQLLSELSICMNSVNSSDNDDEFQKKTNAISEILGLKEKDIGLTISDVISVERSVLRHGSSLQQLGQYQNFEPEQFLLSTLDEKVIPAIDDSIDIQSIEEDLPALGIILFALYQQRCNNPPDSRFEIAIEKQILSDELIPFSTQFSIDDTSVSVLFSPSILNQNDRSGDDAIIDVDDEHLLHCHDDSKHCLSTSDCNNPKKKSGRRSKKSIPSLETYATIK